MTIDILLVEDEHIIALDEAAMLRSSGYSVLVAASGETAVEIAARENPSLVLMDVNLGSGMDGIQAASRIIQDGKRVLFLSSIPPEDLERRTIGLAHCGHMAKCQMEDSLMERLEELVGIPAVPPLSTRIIDGPSFCR